jgi:hypothetical protein
MFSLVAVTGGGAFVDLGLAESPCRSLYVLMPPRNNIGLILSQTHDLGCIVRVRCNYCQSVRHYVPEDVIKLIGDVEVDGLRRRLRCEGCGRRDYVEVEAIVLFPQERVGVVVRRLVKVRTIRRPVWRNEPL